MDGARKEEKEQLQNTQEEDELRLLKHLAERGKDRSISSKTIKEWGLTREKVRDILKQMEGNRKLQTTFTNLVGATRFKAVKEGKLRHALRPRCQAIDSWEHCKQCYGVELGRLMKGKEGNRIKENIMKEITTDTPAIYKASDVKREKNRTLEATGREA